MPREPILSYAGLRVLVCPDAFKGSLSAAHAADQMAQAVAGALPHAVVTRLPLADGGDGSLDALESVGFALHPVTTRGPTGEPVAASYARSGRTVVVELAGSCGLALLPDGVPAPMTSSTLGLGDAISGAVSGGADDLVICLGGSASTDGGLGMLVALGARVTDAEGAAVPPGGGALARIAELDLTGLDPRVRGTRVTVATDVTCPLLGPQGAAAVFAPQKGASPEQVRDLDVGLSQWADVLARASGMDASAVPGAGAAGGAGVAAIAALDATVVSGAEYIQGLVGLQAAIAASDLVLTGEGALDHQSLLGKGVGHVALTAARQHVPVVAVCGRVDLDDLELDAAGFAVALGLDEVAPPGSDPMVETASVLRAATRQAVSRWLTA